MMSNGKISLIFVCLSWLLFGTLVIPPIFKLFNRIYPLVFGLPFVQFWILCVIVLVSGLLIAWYKIEEKRGELD